MPLADKAYEAPSGPGEIEAFFEPGLAETAVAYREAVRKEKRNSITVYFRVRKRNYEQLLWYYISSKTFRKDKIYLPKNLHYWTLSLRTRLVISYPMGRVIETMKCRLGITNPGLKFCLDGFYGMINYTDIFGTTGDSCPWMEISYFSTVKSLKLHEGDNIFISVASAGQIENVIKWRQKRANEPAAHQSVEPVFRISESNSGKARTSLPKFEFPALLQ